MKQLVAEIDSDRVARASGRFHWSPCLAAILFAAAILGVMAPREAAAQTITWSGTAANTNWSTAANWLGTAPANNATRTFTFTGTDGLSNTNDLTGVTATGITFNSSGFVLSGNAITLGNSNLFNNITSGTNTIALNMAMTASRTVTGSGGSTLVLSGNLSGVGGLTTARSTGSGTATFTLSGSNSHTGNTTVAANTLLNINSAYAISSGTMILSAATLSLGNTSGTSVTLSGNPAMRWGDSFSYLGPHSLNLGTGNVTLLNNLNNLSVAEGSTLTVGGNISGAFTVGKVGNGTLWLTGSNSVSNLDTKAGALVLGSSNAAAQVSTLMRIQGGVFGITTGTFIRNVGASGGAISFTSINNGGGFAAYGQGQAVNLTVAGVSGTLTWGSTQGFLTGTQTFILGASDATGAIDFQNPIALNAGTRTIQANKGLAAVDGILSGVLSGNASSGITKTGSGVLALTAANTYTGTTTISAGTLQIGNNGTAGSLAAASRVVNNATLAFFRSDDITYSGTVSGTGSLVKRGAAKLTLGAANTYTGDTTIDNGTLKLASGGSFANSPRIIVGGFGSSGVALDLTDKTSFSIGSNQTLQGIGTVVLGPTTAMTVSGMFSPGNSPGLFTYSGGSTTLSGTTLLEVWGTSRGSGYDAVNVIDSGLLNLGGALVLDFNQNFADDASFLLFDVLTGGSLTSGFSGITITGANNDYTGLTFVQDGSVWTTGFNGNNQGLRVTQTASSVTLDIIVVPEPGTLAIAGIGIAMVSWSAWKRRRAARAAAER